MVYYIHERERGTERHFSNSHNKKREDKTLSNIFDSTEDFNFGKQEFSEEQLETGLQQMKENDACWKWMMDFALEYHGEEFDSSKWKSEKLLECLAKTFHQFKMFEMGLNSMIWNEEDKPHSNN